MIIILLLEKLVCTCFSFFGVQNNNKLAWANAITLDTEGSIAVAQDCG